jgi:TRAP-type mannitol/chloroaromatic compound transport system substrate-binding protein
MQSYVTAGWSFDVYIQAFCDIVRDMSGGRLDITGYVEGAIVPTEDILTATAKGVVPISAYCGAYGTGVMPEGDLESGLPMTWRDGNDVYACMRELGMLDILREAYAEQGVYLLNCSCSGSTSFWLKEPIETVDDLKGVKIRHYGKFAELLNKLGAAATFIPHSDVYMALQLGTIDGSGTAEFFYGMMKYYELCPYYVTFPLLGGASTTNFIIDQDAYNELPQDLKDILEVAGVWTDFDYNLKTMMRNVEMYGNFSEWGTTPIKMSDEAALEMTEVALEFVDEVAAKSPRCAELADILKDYMRMKGYLA